MPTDLSAINLNRLAVFVAVVEAGSFTAAAARLGIAKTMVSTHMQRLEREVGASLLIRTTRHLRLTEAGEAFHVAVQGILQETQDALDALGADATEPRGTLRITAPVDYGASVVAPLLVQLQRRHPALSIELLAGDRLFDLVGERIDAAIRLAPLVDSTLHATRLGSFAEWLVASPLLLRKKMPLNDPRDLATFPLIALSVLPHPTTWKFTHARERRVVHFESSFSTNTAHAVRAAVLAGAGLAVLPDYAAADDVAARRLVRVLPDWSLPGGDIHAVFPAQRFRPLKLRVLLDALRTQISAKPRRMPSA